MKTSKVTKIEKKYKDKKTGEYKSTTILYSKVKDRLKDFREENTNGLIETTPTFLPDGKLMFRARILKDKSNASSAEGTGHALSSEVKGAVDSDSGKVFEKTETIAIGRALAVLGYASDGEIASSEEMEEFEAYKKQKREEMLLACTEKLTDAKSLEELKEVWAGLPVEAKEESGIVTLKEEMKKKYENI